MISYDFEQHGIAETFYAVDCFSEYTRKKMTPFRIAVEKGIK